MEKEEMSMKCIKASNGDVYISLKDLLLYCFQSANTLNKSTSDVDRGKAKALETLAGQLKDIDIRGQKR